MRFIILTLDKNLSRRFPLNETMYRVLLALRSSDQQAANILDGLRQGGGEIPSLAAFYRSLKSGLTEGWLEIAGNDASGPGRPRQIYTLTSFGRRALDKEARRLHALASLALSS